MNFQEVLEQAKALSVDERRQLIKELIDLSDQDWVAVDEALWDAQFAATPTVAFERLIAQGLADIRDGNIDKFDPNIEDD
jgi:hypothetical protein